MFVNRSHTSILVPRVVTQLTVKKALELTGDLPYTPAVPIEIEKKRKPKYLPGERLLKKLNSQAEKPKTKKKKVKPLGEEDVDRLSASVLSVLESLNI